MAVLGHALACLRYIAAFFLLFVGFVFTFGSRAFVERAPSLYSSCSTEAIGIILWVSSYFVVRGLPHANIVKALVYMVLLLGSCELLDFALSCYLGEAAFGIGSRKELITSLFIGSLSLVCLVCFRIYVRSENPAVRQGRG